MQLERTESQEVARHELLDKIEERLLQLGGSVRKRAEAIRGMPQRNFFTPGLYSRELRMAAGSIVTTEIHKTEHPFVVSAGAANVYDEVEEQWHLIRAPHIGITKPGTRRVVVVLEDCVWTTFHATDETNLEVLEEMLFEPRRNGTVVEVKT